jgi:hypothetical protein
MLTVLDAIPDGLLTLEPNELHQQLPEPTLIHLPGRRQPALFVSVLLHGNESTGWLAMRSLLESYRDRPLPRALSLLIGNVAAARYGQRHLPDQPDYNRIWFPGETPEQKMTMQVVDQMRGRGVFASIDIHNNTGRNPHYACVTEIDHAALHLATLFSRIVVYFTRPTGVQAMAFSRLCPSIVLECGQPDQPHGTSHTLEFLQACLHLDHLPQRPVAPQDLDLFHTMAVVKIPPEVSFSFDDPTADIYFPADLDRFNFQELPVHTPLGQIRNGWRLDVRNEAGEEVSQRYFYTCDQQICTAVPVMPSMLTLNPTIIRQDCLCYLMERYGQFCWI